MTTEKLDQQSMAEVSFGRSTSSLVKGAKKTFSNDLWWKILITLAVIIIAGFIIYKEVNDSKKSSEKTNLSSKSEKTSVTKTDELDSCTERSIAGSHATFTYQPLESKKPYTTYGLEFSFKNIKMKPGVETEMTELDSAMAVTSKIHYYYNIRRCEIGGGVRIDEKPYIRGPIVFAVDQQCSKVYFFTEGKGWTQYRSARNMDCSSHGKEEIQVEESKCLEGSITNSISSFVYTPYGNTKPYRASGAEFSFEAIAEKTKLGSRLTPFNKLLASTSKIHYYYNIPRCQIGGGIRVDKEPYIRGPTVFAVDEQCKKVYYFTEGKGWSQYISARDLKCSNHGGNNKTTCLKDSFEGSSFTFQFNSGGIVNATGIQYNFTKLVEKLQDLKTDYNLTRIPELTTSQDVSYYLNLHRCYNGGPPSPNARGAIIFAVSDNCTKVNYLSISRNYQWTPYNSASNIKCVNRHV